MDKNLLKMHLICPFKIKEHIAASQNVKSKFSKLLKRIPQPIVLFSENREVFVTLTNKIKKYFWNSI